MRILSIETSCDETAISVLEFSQKEEKTNVKILSNIIRSQIELHKEFGGVYPNLAKREHAKNLPTIFIENLKSANLFNEEKKEMSLEQKNHLHELLSHEAGLAEKMIEIGETISKPDLDYIAVTTGPGLEPALWVGINFAKALNAIFDIPTIAINHMEGHILSTLIDSRSREIQEINLNDLKFPMLALLVSGGHTELVLIKNWMQYEKIGATKDDALGEAFDKVARLLGLSYPGGPEISRLAKEGQPNEEMKLPRPMIDSKDYNFSFSGIKTAVLYLVKKIGNLTEQNKKDIAREFETAVSEVVVKKTKDAIEEFAIETLIVGGGVSANVFLQESLRKMIEEFSPQTKLLIPDSHLSGDNSIMIALAGFFNLNSKKENTQDLKAKSNWSL